MELGSVWPPIGINALNPFILINICFITPTPVLSFLIKGRDPNQDPTDFSMATWAKNGMYGLLLTRGAFLKENPVNKRGGDGNAWFSFQDKNFEYSTWLLSLYVPWCTEYFAIKGPTYAANSGGYVWTTRSFPFLLAMYNEMYVDGKRIIPQYVFSDMSPSMLAFLIMQNAYVHGPGIRINFGLFSL